MTESATESEAVRRLLGAGLAAQGEEKARK